MEPREISVMTREEMQALTDKVVDFLFKELKLSPGQAITLLTVMVQSFPMKTKIIPIGQDENGRAVRLDGDI